MAMRVDGRHDAVTRLRGAWWVRDRSAQQIFSILGGAERRTKAVGGLVRDTILGMRTPGGDIDMATELLPDDVIERARGAGMSCYPTGFDHGTVTIRNGQVIAEVTTLRQDVATDGRHAKVKFGTDWRADAERRDFTINALYAEQNGALFDPLDGLDDIFSRRVRFIGDADQRIKEDYLRVFRFFRFTASHAREKFDPDGLAACRRAANDLDMLPAERIGAEMIKIMGLPHAVATLAQMTKAGIVDFSVEDLKALLRYEQNTQSPVVAARLALLVGTDGLDRLQAIWRLSSGIKKEAEGIHSAAHMMIAGDLYNAAYRRGRFAYVAIPVACALANWTPNQYAEVNDFWEQMTVPNFPVSGEDLLAAGFEQGPKLGQALHQVEMDWVQSGFAFDRSELLEKLKVYLD